MTTGLPGGVTARAVTPPGVVGLSVRWGALGAGLAAELLGLTISFESPLASAQDLWWVQLAAYAPDLIQIAIAFLATFFVLTASRLKSIAEQARHSVADYLWWPWLLLQILAFGGLYIAAAATFGGSSVGAQLSGRGMALCAGFGIAACLFWLFAFAPPRYWLHLLARECFAFSVALAVATAAWFAGQIARTYWHPMAAGTLFLAGHLLRLVYPEVLADQSGLLLGTPAFTVEIAPQCSGYEGIGLVTVFLALYLWLFRAHIRFPQALLLFPIGAVAVWLANVVRIAMLVGIGTSYSPELALGGSIRRPGGSLLSGSPAVSLPSPIECASLQLPMRTPPRPVIPSPRRCWCPFWSWSDR